MVVIMRPIITLEIEQPEDLYKLEVAGVKHNVQFCVGGIMDKWMVTNRTDVGMVQILLQGDSPSDADDVPEQSFARQVCSISRERFFGIIVYTISW